MKRSKLNKWLADLRSGEFKQIKSKLLAEDKQSGCCLGIYLLNNGPEPTGLINKFWEWDDPIMSSGVNSYTLPDAVVREDGWHSEVGSYKPPESFSTHQGCAYSCLAEANDAGVPFTEIADIVEANPLHFFKSIEEDV